ncbi:hypothetical protein KP509_13G068300 [Ceratopteris richardii]|uniref:Uncharacterized protein n=1 Tax=Ceratopteris richardii TaxID=49495 RepID=A0A8T2TGG0_CERRI|nr:hypothetical protein KP509_13G068300 [Ceratopteris richardii]
MRKLRCKKESERERERVRREEKMFCQSLALLVSDLADHCEGDYEFTRLRIYEITTLRD